MLNVIFHRLRGDDCFLSGFYLQKLLFEAKIFAAMQWIAVEGGMFLLTLGWCAESLLQAAELSQGELLAQHRPVVEIVVKTSPHEVTEAERLLWTTRLEQELAAFWGNSLSYYVQLPRLAPALPPPVWNNSPEKPVGLAELANTQIILNVSLRAGRWELQGKRWLELTQTWTEFPLLTLRNPELIPQRLAEMIISLYAPITHLTTIKEESGTGILVGGEFSLLSPAAEIQQPGDLLQVVMLYYDRLGTLQARQQLPWTYLRVAKQTRSRSELEVISAFRNPLPQLRRRVEIFAYQTSRFYQQSEGTLSVRSDSSRPYAMTPLLISAWNSTSVDSDISEAAPPLIALTTDRSGKFQLSLPEVKSVLGERLLKLEVLSEGSVVARVPWAAGSEKYIELTVPDDSARQLAERELQQLKTRLLRVATKRAVLLAALNRLAVQAQEGDPQPLLEELQLLPEPNSFDQEINLIQVRAAAELNRLGNRVAANQVNQSCQKTRDLVKRHLKQEALEDLKLRLRIAPEK